MWELLKLNYYMMKWYNPIQTQDSLWPVWADTDMSVNVYILTLTPDSLWVAQAATSGLFTRVSEKDYTLSNPRLTMIVSRGSTK